jgi:hypothetical protein
VTAGEGSARGDPVGRRERGRSRDRMGERPARRRESAG